LRAQFTHPNPSRLREGFFYWLAEKGLAEMSNERAQKKHYNGLRNDFSFPAHCNASGATLKTTFVAVTVALWGYVRACRAKVTNPGKFFKLFICF
jgi:hypothetical protein